MKKFLFSAVALIGFTVASYGANTVEVEVNQNLLVEEVQVAVVSPCNDCYHNFSTDLSHSDGSDEAMNQLLATWERCVARYCGN